ncbi:MAG: sigma-70 family RNA polymerase sigma factor [Verrucomicrobia bacterium]|nr:MAG: sigma-70 family RNA polymerase sigma factor [Verrucomicrobiota bacterium]
MLDREAADQLQTQLLHRIATQDREALAEFYDATAGVLFSTALRIVGDAPEAEEVMQDAFVQVWEKAGDFDPELGTPLSWVLRITRNRAIDRIRARQRRSRAMDAFETELAVTPPQSARQLGLNEEDCAKVRSAVRSLPDDQRQAVELAFFGGLSHGEIAESLQQPLGTVKARIRRGMLKLRDTLQPYL